MVMVSEQELTALEQRADSPFGHVKNATSDTVTLTFDLWR